MEGSHDEADPHLVAGGDRRQRYETALSRNTLSIGTTVMICDSAVHETRGEAIRRHAAQLWEEVAIPAPILGSLFAELAADPREKTARILRQRMILWTRPGWRHCVSETGMTRVTDLLLLCDRTPHATL
jgi:hypothetical protein